MLSIYCTLFIVITFSGAVCGDPTTQIIVKKADVKTEDNPFFDPWAVSVISPGDKMTIKIPIKQDLPPDLMMQIVMILDGDEMVNYEISLCAGLEDKTIGKGLVDHGLPQDTFPKACPIKAGKDWEIHEWGFPADVVPPGIPDGPVAGSLTVFEVGKAPIVTLSASGKLAHKLPGFGR